MRFRSDRGVTIPLVAIVMPVLIIMVALAVDLGRQRTSARDMQARADVIALDMVRIIGGRTVQTIACTDAAATAAALTASATRNEVPVSQITNVEWGTVNTAGVFQPATGQCTNSTVPNAVRITAEEDTDYFFRAGTGHVTRTAVGTMDGQAQFQVGTRLVSVNASQAILLNGIANGALGGSLNLTAVGWSGLANAQLPLGPLATQLGVASPDELADTSVGASDFYLAAATVMQNQGNTAAASALNAIALQSTNTTQLDMGDLIEAEQGGSSDALNGSVDLYSFITGSFFAIDGTHALSIPAATLGIAGTTTTVSLTLIEGPKIGGTRVGATATTQQGSVGITATIANLPISIAGLAGVTVSGTIPLNLTLAGGTGTLTSIDCDSTPGITVSLSPQPVAITGSVNLAVYATVLFANLQVASAVLTSTDISSVVVSGNTSNTSFAYTSEFMRYGAPMKAAPTTVLNFGSSLNLSAGHVSVVGVSVSGGTIATALNNLVIQPILTALNSQIIGAQLNTLLGIDIGGADIGALDMSCEGVKLVG